jgi:hypothetical protein
VIKGLDFEKELKSNFLVGYSRVVEFQQLKSFSINGTSSRAGQL